MDADRFLRSIREEVLEPGDIVDELALRASVEELSPAVTELESNPNDLGKLLSTSQGVLLSTLLLGVPVSELIDRPREAQLALQRWRQWTLGAPLSGVLVGLLLRDAHMSRARRRRTKLVQVVDKALSRLTKARTGLSVRQNVTLSQVSRSFDFVVFSEGEPILAVLVMFQTRAGGRQTEIFQALPDLQSMLIRSGMLLAVVADGPGFGNMSQVVKRIAPRLQHLMNMTGIRRGELKGAIDRAQRVHRGELQIGDARSEELFDRVARVALQSGRPVTPQLLSAPVDETGAFLIRFAANNPDYDLRPLEGQGAVAEPADVLQAIAKIAAGEQSVGSVASELSRRLGYESEAVSKRLGVELFAFEIPDSRLRLPAPLPVFEIDLPRGEDRSQAIAEIDDELTNGSLITRLAVVIDVRDAEASRVAVRGPGRSGKPQLAVLGHDDIADIILRRPNQGRELFARRIVDNVDLRLISPFVSEGPAPDAMFFGRDEEIRRIMEQAGSQSFALVGGRKAGKTSILRRLDRLLRERVAVVALDCQAHPDRADFLRYVLELTPNPPIVDAQDLVASSERILTVFVEQVLGTSGGVILLDEVDDLFLADSVAPMHPHVLSRSFRSLAQLGTATMVGTGERALFSLTRDPSSPHWNFCTPILIGPLQEDAARNLLVEPMEALGISVHPDAVLMALDRTARHPNLLQFLGDRVVDSLADLGRVGEQMELSASVVEAIASTGTYQNRFLSTFWSQASTLEKVVSLRLSATMPSTVDQLHEQLRQAVPRLRPSDVDEGLRFLELYTIAVNPGKGWILRDGVFDSYLSAVRNSAVGRQWLEELA